MNYVSPQVRPEEEIEQIRTVVARHAFPENVTGFDVRLGEFDGDPAMWITFQLNDRPGPAGEARDRRTAALSNLCSEVTRDLLDTLHYRFPYFRFEP